MAEGSYNPFFDDDDGEHNYPADSIEAVVEQEENIQETEESKVTIREISKPVLELNYDSIASKLIQDRFVLTALELHTELTESGKPIPRLRDFFSNPGNFERSDGETSNQLYRTSSETTFDSLDMARYSDDGNTQNDEKCALLEFELRKAKDTIKALRSNLTERAEADAPSPVHVPQQAEGQAPEPEESMRPLEKRALNFLVNEYLLGSDYRLTSITFSDENEEQDFDDWDDVGLNVPRPPDLFHLYRDYGRHVIPAKEMVDVGCGEDSIEESQPEEAEADIAMNFDQERLQLEEEVEKLRETLDESRQEAERLQKEVLSLQRELDEMRMQESQSRDVDRKQTSEDLDPGAQIEEQRPGDDDADGAGLEGADETDDAKLNPEQDGELLNGDTHLKRRQSEAFYQALFETVVPTQTSGEGRLVEEVSRISGSETAVVEMLARCLPHIVPNVLLAKREELVPLILSTATLHPDAKERDTLLNLLFNLIKKPDQEQREVILNGCVAFAKKAGRTRVETELLPQCWEQITHKFMERRLLVAQSCGALAPYLPPEIVGSLVMSMLQQLLDDKADEVKEVAVKSLGIVFSLIQDEDKYNQGLDLLFNTLKGGSSPVSSAAQNVFLPAFASWAGELGRLESSIVTALLKRLEISAMDVQRSGSEMSGSQEQKILLYCQTLKCIIPASFVSILEGVPTLNGDSPDDYELPEDRFPDFDSPLLDIKTIIGDEAKLVKLMCNYEYFVKKGTDVQRCEQLSWFIHEFIPRVLEVTNRINAGFKDITQTLSDLFSTICRVFGEDVTDSKIIPKFQAVLNLSHDQDASKIQNGQYPLTKSTLPVFACGVLISHQREEDKEALGLLLQESLTWLALSGSPSNSIELAFTNLHNHGSYDDMLLSTLWSCVVHENKAVRVLTAKMFELLARSLSEALVSSRVVPALITLSGDPEMVVREACIPAFGTIIEYITAKETVERVYTQFQSFLDDPINKDELPILKQAILTMGKAGPAAEPKFRDEFILPRLTAIAHGNTNVVEEWRKKDIAMALFEAYSALSCCFISAQLIQSAMLPGLRCLRRDLELLSPEHGAVVSSMMRDFESKVYGRERAPSGASGAPPSVANSASVIHEDTKHSLKNRLGAQKTKVTNVFSRKK